MLRIDDADSRSELAGNRSAGIVLFGRITKGKIDCCKVDRIKTERDHGVFGWGDGNGGW